MTICHDLVNVVDIFRILFAVVAVRERGGRESNKTEEEERQLASWLAIAQLGGKLAYCCVHPPTAPQLLYA